MSNDKWQRISDFVGTEIAENFVILSMDGQYVQLNTTAREIWDLIEEPKSKAEIAADLQQVFEVEEVDCLSAIDRTIEELSDHKLIKQVTG